MNRTRTMALAGALMLGGSLGARPPAARAQAYADPAGGAYYGPAPAPPGYPAYPGPAYPPAALTTAAPPPAPADDTARITALEERIRTLESRLRGAGDPDGPVLDFTGHEG